jgi:Tol biopolymer transport system component
VSVNSDGVQGDRGSFFPVLSANGRFVAFDSDARNLVPGDTNTVADVFVYDRKKKTSLRVSVNSDGEQTANQQESFAPSLSANGRIVAFESLAANLDLALDDGNNVRDIFVRDLKTKETVRVSVDSDGNEGNGASFVPALSGNGHLVAFASFAPNLVAGDANGFLDIFVHELKTGKTMRVSVDSHGHEGHGASFAPALSYDGRFVAFESLASDLVERDTNGASDIFVHDRQTGETTRVSVNDAGNQGNGGSFAPALSADGRLVAFESSASNLAKLVNGVNGDLNQVRDIFVRDRQLNKTVRVSVSTGNTEGNGDSFAPAFSANGRFVAFASFASNLDSQVPDTNLVADVFRHDRNIGETIRMSVNANGVQGNRGSFSPALSANGRFITFDSDASNLVEGDTPDGFADIFVK